MKCVMLSIQTKCCELIASGKKTVEVRKTKPKLETPFKCYIYCTKGKSSVDFITKSEKFGYITGHEGSFYNRAKEYDANGKVIGEFVCDEIFPIIVYENGNIRDYNGYGMERSCVRYDDISSYIGKNRKGYGWHITNLVIYDKPKELSEFYHYCGDNPNCEGCEAHYYSNTECGMEDYCCSPMEGCKLIKRPFQSWGYVYEVDT